MLNLEQKNHKTPNNGYPKNLTVDQFKNVEKGSREVLISRIKLLYKKSFKDDFN